MEFPSSQQYDSSPRTPVGGVGSSRPSFQDRAQNEDEHEEDIAIVVNEFGKSEGA